ncbi:ribonuclease R [Rhodococcus opacus PD630]|uniref:RNB domain-containing ribonuclease n=1 Tax=Rhodococcus TaxID=1827 RepID=UPI00029CC8B0|nr:MULTISPECIES: RNB domain-containing ribonuclease [Rhodococcus]KXF51399.1 ribonuclease II [Rhodococcus sp. SC4]AHK32475.1 Ribonuclease R [Rhodococcus opacus PD630]EHI42468.1 ribonuclease R [Rhodococcus opacus PD630]PBC50308.1 RNB domain-containing ribonuclease [Rhodococcus sp. ACPA1]UDG94851.1 RNB domain-containing ribonuclease [Rhodococcus opacus PD630]
MSRFVARGIDFGAVRTEFHLPEGYPPAAVAQARAASDRYASEREDRTDLAFVTIDPPDSLDLDQALHLDRTRDGFVLHYAIADVGAVVEPGGVLDVETRKRGQTFYLPDGKVPLHPKELSEGSASLLPDEDRPAVVWRIELDESARPLSCTVSRATVRSVARLDYAGVQADSEAGRLHPSIASLPEFGRLRTAAAVARGAIELRLPEQEVVPDGDGWRVDLAPRTEADDWNAEVSLLTGMCAAAMMLDAKVGLLRTLPPAGPDAVEALRRTASALGIDWPESVGVGELLARLDPNSASTLVLMTEAPSLLRGADYAAFDGALPELTTHAAIGAPYAHVTAPLRRLSDRYSTEVCLAVTAGTPVPSWARDALGSMPEIMVGSDSLASKIDRACIDLTEATVLADRVGETFDATVLRSRNGKRTADVFVPSVSVMAKCVGDPAEGEQVKIRLVSADVAKRTVEFGYPA